MGDFGKVNSLKAPNKTLALVFLTMALVYNVIFGFIRNPAGTDNTLSYLGYDYPHGFLMWGVLTAAALFLNIIFMYKEIRIHRQKRALYLQYALCFLCPALFL
mgnify:CR=1 FL=1